MNSRDILPYAAVVMYAAMVLITSWLSYRRILRKYPKQDAPYQPTEAKRP